MSDDGLLVQVRAPHFTAGFVVRNGKVDTCAPILRRDLLGKTEGEARLIIARKGWSAIRVEPKKDQS